MENQILKIQSNFHTNINIFSWKNQTNILGTQKANVFLPEDYIDIGKEE